MAIQMKKHLTDRRTPKQLIAEAREQRKAGFTVFADVLEAEAELRRPKHHR